MKISIYGVVVVVLGVLLCWGSAAQAATITNPDYDGNSTGWSSAKYVNTWGEGPLVWWYATSGLSITAPRSAPGMAKTEWVGHNEGRHCSIYQTLTGTAGQQYIISVYGQCVTNNQTSQLQLRAADGTNSWDQASPPGTVVASIVSVGGDDTWRVLSGTFTPSSNTFEIGLTWLAGGSGAPWAIVVAAADDWSIQDGIITTPTNTPITITTPTNTPPQCCLGDADKNLFVNGLDYASVRDHFGESNPAGGMGDANCDDFVGPDDYRAVRDHFGEPCGS